MLTLYKDTVAKEHKKVNYSWPRSTLEAQKADSHFNNTFSRGFLCNFNNVRCLIQVREEEVSADGTLYIIHLS